MKTEKNYLEQNIARLLKQSKESTEPDKMFKESLLNSALQELARQGGSHRRWMGETQPVAGGGRSKTAGIDQIMKAAAMIAIVCGAAFELLISGFAWVNASFASALFVTMIVNGITYLGGLIL